MRVQENYWSRVLLSVGVSTLFYELGFTAFLFVIPLLLLSDRYGSLEEKLMPFAVSAIVLALFEIVPLFPQLGEPLEKGFLAMGLFLPIALIGSSVIWILLERYDTLSRFLIVSGYVAVVIFGFASWFSAHTDVVKAIEGEYLKVLNQLFYSNSESAESLVSGVNANDLLTMVKNIVSAMILPSITGMFGFNVFLQMSARNKNAEEFSMRVFNAHLPYDFVWFFLASWLALIAVIKFSAPTTVTIVVVNIALFASLLYAIQGLCIVGYKMVQKGRTANAVKLFLITGLLVVMLPGMNIVIVLVLPIIGVLETWFTFRK